MCTYMHAYTLYMLFMCVCVAYTYVHVCEMRTCMHTYVLCIELMRTWVQLTVLWGVTYVHVDVLPFHILLVVYTQI